MTQRAPLTTRRRRAGLTLVVGTALLVAACSSDAADPSVEHRDRVRVRLEESFSNDEARCILDALEPADLATLDTAKDLPADNPVLVAFGDAVRSCVAGEGAAPTTTAAGAATTTAPAPTTTAGG